MSEHSRTVLGASWPLFRPEQLEECDSHHIPPVVLWGITG